MISNWVKYKIEDICSVTDCKHDTAPVVNYKTDYKMLRTSNIKNGVIDVENVDYVTEETYIQWSARGFLEKGDIILTREAPIGEVGIIKTDDKLFLGQRLLQLKAKKDIVTPEFLHYSLLSPYFQNQIRRSNNTGSIVSNVKIPDLKKMEIFLPPIDVQRHIAKILENLDNQIAINKEINKQLEEIAQTIYNYWFVQFEFPNEEGKPYKFNDGEMIWDATIKAYIPVDWSVYSLGDLFTFEKGKIPEEIIDTPCENYFPYLTIDALNQGKATYVKDGLFVHNEVMIVVDGAASSTVYQGHSGILASTLSKLVLLNEFLPSELLYYLMKTYEGIFKKCNTGSTVPHANKNYINSFKVALPPIQTLQSLSKTFIEYRKLIINNNKQNYELTELRNFLLPMLMNGQIKLDRE